MLSLIISKYILMFMPTSVTINVKNWLYLCADTQRLILGKTNDEEMETKK